MLSHLNGIVDSKNFNPNFCVVDVNGIGFTVFVSHKAWQDLKVNEAAKLYTSLSISQENVKIYGFAQQWELKLFEMLNSVKGIGAKSALAILDSVGPQRILEAVQKESAEILASAPGVGKKTAERIIFELKPKVRELQMICGNTSDDASGGSDLSGFSEVMSILESLGYNQFEIDKALKANKKDAESNTQDMLKACLTWLNSN
ncbi:MAG: Holliday junction branch migration protein RuvA [Candidatus Caenarcaniphilales bacterium]|nr:Holliday junction branch migration protein RuvA [Candidatus Caenarcaniphilales bacterium]